MGDGDKRLLRYYSDVAAQDVQTIMDKVSQNFMGYYVDGDKEDLHEFKQMDAGHTTVSKSRP